MAEKRVKLNEVYVSGECLNISDVRKLFEGTGRDALTYKLHIETAPNEIKVVEFFTNMYKSNGEENTMYEGVATICNEIITRAESGKGDMVNCVCTLDDNTYYSEGKKIELVKISGNFCNREKDGKTIKADQLWRVDVLVEEIETRTDSKGEYTHVRGLVNKFGTNGLYVNFRIHEKEMIDGFNSLYTIGSVGKLEGTFEENVSESKSGFGKRTKRSIDRYLEIVGGDEPINTVEKDGKLVVSEVADVKNPFHIDNVNAMKEKIETRLEKLKEKDATKTANSKTISDEDVPF